METMITPPNLNDAIWRARSVTDDNVLWEDVWRVRNAWFGPYYRPLANGGTMLLFGARSGLEALLASLANKTTRIIVVEQSGVLRNRLAKLLGQNVEIYPSALRADLPKQITFARIDKWSFDPETLRAIFADRRVTHICGEATAGMVDPLTLYRWYQSRADSFFFQFAELGYSIAGNKAPAPVEVSVVVPAYKVAAFLPQCLDSLLHQTMCKLEVIVVDDGSPDESGQIAENYAEHYPDRFRVIHQPNGGCASARMAGLKSARGEFVGFVDGDDWVEPQMYEELYRVAALRGCDVAQCGFYEWFTDGTRQYHDPTVGGDGLYGVSGVVEDVRRLPQMIPAIWRKIYRREFLLREGLEFPAHIRRHDDLPFAFNVMERASRLGLIPDWYYAYRLGRPGQDVEARDERLFVHFDIFEYLRKCLRGDDLSWKKFRDVQSASHGWALARIAPRLWARYWTKVVRQAGIVTAVRALAQTQLFRRLAANRRAATDAHTGPPVPPKTARATR